MQVDFSLFAEAAEVSDTGELSLLGGGIDFVKGPEFPATIHSLFLIVKLLADPADCVTEHDFCSEIVAPDGRKPVADVHVRFTPRPHPRKPTAQSWTMLTIHYERLEFASPGDYRFRYSVDGRVIGETLFEAVKE